MGEILERSLTEMDWLLQLNGFSASVDSSESDNREGNTGLGESCGVMNLTPQSSLAYGGQTSGDYRGRNVKPPFSYTHLITLAISSTPRKRMALSEIYQWIKDNYPYYRTAAPGWKNSVRHNLSLNKNFVKVARRKDEPGKGAYWALESSVVKKLNSRGGHQMTAERVPLVSCENALNDSYNSVMEQETAFAVQTISQQPPAMIAFSPLDYSDEEEVQTIIDEVETVTSSEQHCAGGVYPDLSQNLEWLKTSFNGKLDSSWSAAIDLDLLMASLKSENGKSFNFDHIADLVSSSSPAVQHHSSCVEDRNKLGEHDDMTTHFTELRPLFDASLTSSAEFDRYTSLYNEHDVPAQHLVQNGHSLYVLDHSNYTYQPQHAALSIHRPYPQQTVAVVGRSKMVPTGAMPGGSSQCCRHDMDDDIEDDFNWENLIDKTEDNRPLPSVATHC